MEFTAAAYTAKRRDHMGNWRRSSLGVVQREDFLDPGIPAVLRFDDAAPALRNRVTAVRRIQILVDALEHLGFVAVADDARSVAKNLEYLVRSFVQQESTACRRVKRATGDPIAVG